MYDVAAEHVCGKAREQGRKKRAVVYGRSVGTSERKKGRAWSARRGVRGQVKTL